MAESSSVSNNVIFHVFQKCFQNVQLFSVNWLKAFNVYTDSWTTNYKYINTTLIF